jgi:SAM-dependent methyltransferase
VRLEVADVGALPYRDGEFDVVVCFNVIEQLQDPASALDELVRVLAADGIVLVSSPNPAAGDHSNPHARHRYAPERLDAELQSRLPHVKAMAQNVYLTAAVLRDDDYLVRGDTLKNVSLLKTVGGEPGGAEFRVALAGRSELPAVSPVVVMASSQEVKRWYGALAEQQALAAGDRARILELEELAKDLTAIPQLQARVAALEEELRRARRTLADVTGSASWRLTAPLRRAKRAIARK